MALRRPKSIVRQPASLCRIVQEVPDRTGQLARIVLRHDDTILSVPTEIPVAMRIRRDDSSSCSHRFQNGQAEAFVSGCLNEQSGRVVEKIHFLVCWSLVIGHSRIHQDVRFSAEEDEVRAGVAQEQPRFRGHSKVLLKERTTQREHAVCIPLDLWQSFENNLVLSIGNEV